MLKLLAYQRKVLLKSGNSHSGNAQSSCFEKKQISRVIERV